VNAKAQTGWSLYVFSPARSGGTPGEKKAEWLAGQLASHNLFAIRWQLEVGVFEDVPAPNGLRY
jgi:hypothetical protein